MSFTISWSSLKFMCTKLVMTLNHLIPYHPLLLLPRTIFPSILAFSTEATLGIRGPNYWSFSISLSNESSGLISIVTLCAPHSPRRAGASEMEQDHMPSTCLLFVTNFSQSLSLIRGVRTYRNRRIIKRPNNNNNALIKQRQGISGDSAGKESACHEGDLGSVPGFGRSPGERKGYQLQYHGQQNSLDCTVHGIAKSGTRLSNFPNFHFKQSQGPLDPPEEV